jgi:hypothetical protein
MDRASLLGHGLQHRPGLSLAEAPLDLPLAAPRLAFSELYATKGIIGLRLTDQARDLAGRTVIIRGYMAPPLEDAADFFVLTRSPIPACPFCDNRAGWPDDIVMTLLKRESGFIDPFQPIEIAGTLDVGRKRDARTGAPLLLRVVDASWRILPAMQ